MAHELGGGCGVAWVECGVVCGDCAGLDTGDAMTDLEDAFARALRLAAEEKNYTQSQARPLVETPEQEARPDVPPAEEIPRLEMGLRCARTGRA